MENISKHITYAEATKSQVAVRRGLDNTPNEVELKNMKHVAENIFEPLRAEKGIPVAVTSFFRSRKVNQKIGGSVNSQHCKGEAMDLDADVFGGWTNSEIFDFIRLNLEFDQLIWEFGNEFNPEWVHVSLKREGKNRKQILVAYIEDEETKYKPYEE